MQDHDRMSVAKCSRNVKLLLQKYGILLLGVALIVTV